MISYLFIIIGIVWLIFATIFDIKTREIPDWLNYSLIATGLGLRLMYSFYDSFWFFLYGILGAGIAFLFGSAMYYGRQWGGGDVKLVTGLGAMFGSNPGLIELNLPFFLVFIINTFIVGAAIGIIYAVILAMINRRKFIKEVRRLDFKVIYFILIFIFLILLAGILFFSNLLLIILFFSIFLLFFVFLFGFMKAVEKSCMYKMINVGKLTEGDLLVNDIKIGRVVKVSHKTPGLTRKDIEIIRKLKIKEVLIREGIPFAPNFLIGLFITIFYGNLLSILW